MNPLLSEEILVIKSLPFERIIEEKANIETGGAIMEKEKLDYFKKRLLKEKDRVYDLLHQMEANETINSTSLISSELSFYDNHPFELAAENYEMERGQAFKEHEITILRKIEDAITNIENGSYGRCNRCGRDLPEERLEFIPYAEFCVSCQQYLYERKPQQREKNNRSVEEEVLGQPFGYGFNDYDDMDYEVGFDAEDSYQAVQRFDYRDDSGMEYEFIDPDNGGYVEPIERISNQQYRSQLPD